MTGNCAVFLLWSECTAGGISIGSFAELLTVLVTTLALIAAAYAGYQAKIAATSARIQAKAAIAALNLDISTRERAQARLVYAEQTTAAEFRMPKVFRKLDFDLATFTWDVEAFSSYRPTIIWGEPSQARHLEHDSVIADVTVHNDSAEMISRVYLYFENMEADEKYDSRMHVRSVETAIATALSPGEAVGGRIMIPLPGPWPDGFSAAEAISGWVPVIEFRDASGVWWLRRGADRIRKIARHPDELPRRKPGPTPLLPEPEIEPMKH